ncbi:MAG: hypothetical protein K0B15_08810 [Lentimicrobium sp.]|nr:hypothetical protein [Lentimicrobium sp.]
MEEILSPEQWKFMQIQLKIKFPELTDDDLPYHESLESDLLMMVSFALKRNILKIPGIFTRRTHLAIYHEFSL